MKLVETNDKDFSKDTSTGAVINTNVNAYKAYKKQRDLLMGNQRRDAEIAALQEDVAELKRLLKQIIK